MISSPATLLLEQAGGMLRSSPYVGPGEPCLSMGLPRARRVREESLGGTISLQGALLICGVKPPIEIWSKLYLCNGKHIQKSK